MNDHFQPEKLLAAGPSAKVYRGVEGMTGRKVLIKVLLEEHETPYPLDRERLQLLAHSFMHVRGPHIAGLITLLPTEDDFALVYEFMPGMNAREFATARRITPPDLRAVAVQLMQALMCGEQMRTPHGDPKPSNLIIADHPAGGLFLQVQDWGVSLARTNHAAETLWFRAPELHSADAVPTSRSDLFTAACSLFVLATNMAPAQGDSVEQILSEWRTFDIAALRQVRPDIDSPFIDWLGWLLKLDPAQRPQSAAQALDALMHSMHTGIIHMPQQAPVMPAGFQTGQLIPAANPNAPRPKPITPKNAASGTESTPKTTATKNSPAALTQPGRSKGRLALIWGINLTALAIAGIAIYALTAEGGWKNALHSLGEKVGLSEPVQPAPIATAADKAPPTAATDAAAAPAAPPPNTVMARHVRIDAPKGIILNLAEVEIISGGKNVGPLGKARQSSTEWDGKAEFANDGDTNGDETKGGKFSHTNAKDKNPRWELDLGEEYPIEAIVIWNRTDEKFRDRMKGFTVKLRSKHQSDIWQQKVDAAPMPSTRLEVHPQ